MPRHIPYTYNFDVTTLNWKRHNKARLGDEKGDFDSVKPLTFSLSSKAVWYSLVDDDPKKRKKIIWHLDTVVFTFSSFYFSFSSFFSPPFPCFWLSSEGLKHKHEGLLATESCASLSTRRKICLLTNHSLFMHTYPTGKAVKQRGGPRAEEGRDREAYRKR